MLQHEIMAPSSAILKNEDRKLEDTFEFDSDRNCYDDLMLKQELKQAAEHCQHLAQKLCKNDGSSTPRKKQQNSMITAPDVPDLSECCREQKLKLKATVAENIRLRQVLKDVTEINKRWQKYNKQQKDYIQRLQNTVDLLQVNDVQGRSSSEEEPFKVKEQTQLMDQAATLSSLRNSYENAVKENCRLHKELTELKKKEEEKEDSKEKERVETKKEYWSQEEDLREAKEQTELLRIQVRAHKEDWQAEKAEKEEARRSVQEKEAELLELRNKCAIFQLRLQKIQDATQVTLDGSGGRTHEDGWRPLRRTSSAAAGVNLKQNSLTSHGSHNGPQMRIVARGVSGRDFHDDAEIDGVLTYRPPVPMNTYSPLHQRISPPLNRSTLRREPSSFEIVEDNLKDMVSCPGCEMNFTTEQHLLFLDHFEECQKVKHEFKESVSD